MNMLPSSLPGDPGPSPSWEPVLIIIGLLIVLCGAASICASL